MSRWIKYSELTNAATDVVTITLDDASDGVHNSTDSLGFEKLTMGIYLSAVPSAGTMDISVLLEDASEYVSVLNVALDLTEGSHIQEMNVVGAEAIRFTPTSYDAGKTYDIRIYGKDL